MTSLQSMKKDTNNSCDSKVLKEQSSCSSISGVSVPNRCYFCDLVEPVTDKLNEHLINAHSELIFCCDICKKYLPRLLLMPHMFDHANKSRNASAPESSSKNRFKCDKCQKAFRSFSGIKYHMNSKHVQLKLFKCEICQQNFTSKRVQLNHERSMHNKEQRDYCCNECGKTFKTDSTLYTHIKLHTDLKPFQCSHCSKVFRLKHHLKSHMVQHKDASESSTLVCNVCNRNFMAMDNLRKHKKIHDQLLEDFICHICGVKTKQKRYLKTHMKRVHLKTF